MVGIGNGPVLFGRLLSRPADAREVEVPGSASGISVLEWVVVRRGQACDDGDGRRQVEVRSRLRAGS